MLVKIQDNYGIFIPDALVTNEVVRALLTSTSCQAKYNYAQNKYFWQPEAFKIELHQFSVEDLIPIQETGDGS